MIHKYRIRQVAACFVLERQDHDGLDYYWQILDQGYSWEWAKRVAAEYRCQII